MHNRRNPLPLFCLGFLLVSGALAFAAGCSSLSGATPSSSAKSRFLSVPGSQVTDSAAFKRDVESDPFPTAGYKAD